MMKLNEQIPVKKSRDLCCLWKKIVEFENLLLCGIKLFRALLEMKIMLQLRLKLSE